MRQLRLGNLVIDRDGYCVFDGKRATDLTPTELELLWHMARHAEKVLSREALWQAARGKEVNGPSRSLDTHIARLRRKIVGNEPWTIRAVPGRGYVLTNRPRAPTTKPTSMRTASYSEHPAARKGGIDAWLKV
jgi:DNA-binding response OmpR family regulator